MKDLGGPKFHADVASLLVEKLLDSPKDREQDLLTKLVAALGAGSAPALAADVIAECVASNLGMLEDLAIDIPFAPKALGKLVGRLAAAGQLKLDTLPALLADVDEEGGLKKALGAAAAAVLKEEKKEALLGACSAEAKSILSK